jgi:hypothetical protein
MHDSNILEYPSTASDVLVAGAGFGGLTAAVEGMVQGDNDTSFPHPEIETELCKIDRNLRHEAPWTHATAKTRAAHEAQLQALIGIVEIAVTCSENAVHVSRN